ncbi:unnamed protein product [marine sediment metagenome]|uniref:TFIIS-type domain-containing protein n=1 Tax=marine sediment metagenome TaxID=412755 RepID=X1HFI0_9ZZZZ
MICPKCCYAMNILTHETRPSTSIPNTENIYDIYRCPNCGYQKSKWAYSQKTKRKKGKNAKLSMEKKYWL